MRVLKWWNWRGLMGKKAWMPSELAPIMGLSFVCARRYLRMAYFLGILERKHFGRYWYYALKDAFDMDEVSVCSQCGQLVTSNICACGAQDSYPALKPKESTIRSGRSEKAFTKAIKEFWEQ